MLSQIFQEYKGIVVSALIGVFALIIGAYTPSSLNSVILALFFGILVGNLIKLPADVASGVTFTSGKLLELSIIFLAFSINYTHIAALGVGSFAIVAVVLFTIVILSFFLARKFKCPGSTGWLVGFGTAICGSSAIAALSPSITKEKEDVAIAMAVVNLFGTIGMIVLPLLLVEFGLDTAQTGLLIGGSLHSVGNVAGAGYAMSPEVGEAALTIKLARVALLTPGLILFNYLVNRETVSSWKEHFRLPWYLIGFILITVFVSFVDIPTPALKGMDTIGKVVLTIAMAAIGMKVSFVKLIQSGKKGLSFGLIIFLIQLVLISMFLFIS
jgi:uncharacterized integral membrane protein (TIGR00698 family)